MWARKLYFRRVSAQFFVYVSPSFLVYCLIVQQSETIKEFFLLPQVSDGGLRICETIKIEVLEPPIIRLEPPSISLLRGDSIRIRCLATQNNQIQEKLGYSWTKNHALFHSDPECEMWEDLYHPDGSILTIKNIYKSAIYSCSISNSLAPVSTSIHVNVMDAESMSICPENTSYGIKWLATSSGPPMLNDCPLSYNGKAQRYCEQRDYNKSVWLTPDFSDCINQKLLEVSLKVIQQLSRFSLKV